MTRSRIATLILNAPLFSFTPLSPTPTATSPANFNEARPQRDPRATPVKIPVALSRYYYHHHHHYHNDDDDDDDEAED